MKKADDERKLSGLIVVDDVYQEEEDKAANKNGVLLANPRLFPL